MSPSVGRSRPAIRFKSVVLPDPDGPMSARNSPRVTSRFRSARTLISSLPRTNDLYSPRTCTIGSAMGTLLFLLARLQERHHRSHLGLEVDALLLLGHAHLDAHRHRALGPVGDRHQPVDVALVDAVGERLRPDAAGH